MFVHQETDMNLHHDRKARQQAETRVGGGGEIAREGIKETKRKKRSKLNKTEFNITVHENISMCWCCVTFPARSKARLLPMRESARGIAAQLET